MNNARYNSEQFIFKTMGNIRPKRNAKTNVGGASIKNVLSRAKEFLADWCF